MAGELKQYFSDFVAKTKEKITALTKTELDNESKKATLDAYITSWATAALNKSKLGVVTKWFIKKYVIKNIDDITQFIYDLIKARVVGITTVEKEV